MPFKSGAKSVVVHVARQGGGALSADRAALKRGADGEFWPEPGKTWQRFYRTLNSKFYGERLVGNDVHMETQYARCDDNEFMASLHSSCKVQLADGSTVVKIIVAR